jgi:hypothetical protein
MGSDRGLIVTAPSAPLFGGRPAWRAIARFVLRRGEQLSRGHGDVAF